MPAYMIGHETIKNQRNNVSTEKSATTFAYYYRKKVLDLGEEEVIPEESGKVDYRTQQDADEFSTEKWTQARKKQAQQQRMYQVEAFPPGTWHREI